jgi:ABC-type branched-subunit amino acid transport system substrate-binding protein
MSRSRLGRCLVAGVAATALVAACGSSKNAASGGSSTTLASGSGTTGAGTTGSSSAPFKVMVAGDFTSSGLAYTTPEVVPAAKGLFRNNPNITVIPCDTKSSAGAADACEVTAVQDKVSAVILGFSNIGQSQAILTKAGIPTIGDTDDTAVSSTAFSISNGIPQYYGIGIGMAEAGCHKFGTLYLDGTDFLANAIKSGAASKGLQEAARAAIAANAPDLAPAVAKLTGAGVDCIALSVVPTQIVQAVTAINQSGKKIRVAAVSAIFLSQILSTLGSALNGAISINSVRTGDDPAAGIAQVKADMAAIDPKAPVTELAVIAWIGAKLIEDALPSVKGPVTASSLLAALNGLRNASTDGVIPPFSAVPIANPAFARLFNHYAINYQIENGKSVALGGFYDLAPAL